MNKIYLDNSATTPVDPNVVKAMLPYFSDKFGNASSVHSFGQEARSAIDQSREKIANFLGCKTTEIIFTSGGSESDNLAIRGVAEAVIPDLVGDPLLVDSRHSTVAHGLSEIEDLHGNDTLIPHIITSEFEHHAVLEVVKQLESEGKIEATYISPNKEGLISVDDIEKAIKKNTVLVSIMYVNNEIGTVQPIREIGQMIEKKNKANSSRIFFHTDAVQAVEYFPMNVDFLHVDLLTMSAHKIYGPKGVGLLYVRKGTPLKHQIVGGGQEYKMRAGTENVAGIVGFGEAVELISVCHPRPDRGSTNNEKLSVDSRHSTNAHGLSEIEDLRGNDTQNLHNKLIDGILNKIPNSFLNGSRDFRSPANVNISFINAEGESILLNLDMEGIAASTGSACTSGSLSPSHVLLSMGLKPEECHGSIRFTLGRNTTEEEIDRVLKVLSPIVERLRKMSPFI